MAITSTSNILQTPVEFLRGVGPLRADMLKKELQIFTFDDLLHHFPLRHIDRTSVTKISMVDPDADFVQVRGTLKDLHIEGAKTAKRLVGFVSDGTSEMELVWFKGISWIQKNLLQGQHYLVFGKPGLFNNKLQMVHPELEVFNESVAEGKAFLEPIYPTTEKLKARGLNGRQLAKLMHALFEQVSQNVLPEIIPSFILNKEKFIGRFDAYRNVHFPKAIEDFQQAVERLKFEELFITQIHLNKVKLKRQRRSKGVVFEKVGDLFNDFYRHHLHFELTNAQKRVLKEIRNDTAHGHQMNRLLQGDVGSGKTIVALLCNHGYLY